MAEALLPQKPDGVVGIIRQRLQHRIRIAHHNRTSELGPLQQRSDIRGPAERESGKLLDDRVQYPPGLHHEESDKDAEANKLCLVERDRVAAEPRATGPL